MRPERHRSQSHKGFSLLEVLFSIAILSFSLSAIGYLTYSGMIASSRSLLQSESLWHAQTIMEELISGCRASTTQPTQRIQDGSDWFFKVQCLSTDNAGIMNCEVTVWKSGRWRDASEVKLERMVMAKGMTQ